MSPRLPEYLDFFLLSSRGCQLSGSVSGDKMERLSAVTIDSSYNDNRGKIYAEMEFGHTANINYLKGFVSASLNVRCQRCMEGMNLLVKSTFNYGLCTHETNTDNFLDMYEPLLLEDNNNSLIKVLEDELLLSLPIVATHKEACSDYLKLHNEQNEIYSKKDNPFSVLKDLIT